MTQEEWLSVAEGLKSLNGEPSFFRKPAAGLRPLPLCGIPESVKQLYDRRVEEMTPYFQHCNYGAWEA